VAQASSRGFGGRDVPRTPKWTVSRVLFRRPVARAPARIIHLGDALPRRSSTLTRTLAPAPNESGEGTSSGSPSTASLFELAPERACLAAGHPAVARGLLPHDFTLACASAGASRDAGIVGHRRCDFCCAFPRVAPGRCYRLSCPAEPGLSSRERCLLAGDPPSTSGGVEASELWRGSCGVYSRRAGSFLPFGNSITCTPGHCVDIY
jgi:hypothetical protein